MAQVRNLTADYLGWAGLPIPPGQVVNVPDDTATHMVTQCPDKFALEPVVAPKQGNGNPSQPRHTRSHRKR